MKKNLAKFAVSIVLSMLTTSCSDDSSSPDIFIDEPPTADVTDGPCDYYYENGIIHRIKWLDNYYHISSRDEQKVTVEFLASKGVAVKDTYKSHLDDDAAETETDPCWLYFEVEPSAGINSVADLRRMIDDDEVYCSPVKYDTPTRKDWPWTYGLYASSKKFRMNIKDGKRADFLNLYHSYDATSEGGLMSMTLIAPNCYTGVELCNILHAEGLTINCTAIFTNHIKSSPIGL